MLEIKRKEAKEHSTAYKVGRFNRAGNTDRKLCDTKLVYIGNGHVVCVIC